VASSAKNIKFLLQFLLSPTFLDLIFPTPIDPKLQTSCCYTTRMFLRLPFCIFHNFSFSYLLLRELHSCKPLASFRSVVSRHGPSLLNLYFSGLSPFNPSRLTFFFPPFSALQPNPSNQFSLIPPVSTDLPRWFSFISQPPESDETLSRDTL